MLREGTEVNFSVSDLYLYFFSDVLTWDLALTHSWVNVDFMLDACLVGFLVPESYSS